MEKSRNSRLFEVFDYLKSSGKIKTYIAFGEAIGENKAGINDLKMGRKKMGIDHLYKLKKSYPLVELDFLLGFSDQMWADKAGYASESIPSYKDQSDLIQALRETIASKSETIDTLKKLLENK